MTGSPLHGSWCEKRHELAVTNSSTILEAKKKYETRFSAIFVLF